MTVSNVSAARAGLDGTARSSQSRSNAAIDPAAISRGQELARLEVEEMVAKILRRASEHRLDRGLSLSLPFFDDAAGEIRWRSIEVIPRGRILFVPAFVVQAVEREASKISQEAGLTESTRVHLLSLLESLRRAFDLPATA
jgi:hypothetical protein